MHITVDYGRSSILFSLINELFLISVSTYCLLGPVVWALFTVTNAIGITWSSKKLNKYLNEFHFITLVVVNVNCKCYWYNLMAMSSRCARRRRRYRHHRDLRRVFSTYTTPSQSFLSVHPTFSSHLVVGFVPACDAAAGRFRCNNTNCIYSSYKCNFYDNCGDNSDEDNCGEPVKLDEQVFKLFE